MKGLLKNDKVCFCIICTLTLAIAAFGICAKSIYNTDGGFACGFACSLLLLGALAIVFSACSSETKKRTADVLVLSLFMVLLYIVLFFACDLANASIYTLKGYTGMGITAVVFMALFMVCAIFAVTKLALELFNVRWDFYEKLLKGTLSKEDFANIFGKSAQKKTEQEQEWQTASEEDNETASEACAEAKAAEPAYDYAAEQLAKTQEVMQNKPAPLKVEPKPQTTDDTILADDPALSEPVVEEPIIQPLTEEIRMPNDADYRKEDFSQFAEEETDKAESGMPIISEADGSPIEENDAPIISDAEISEDIAEQTVEADAVFTEETADTTEVIEEQKDEEEQITDTEEIPAVEEELTEDEVPPSDVQEDDPFGEE